MSYSGKRSPSSTHSLYLNLLSKRSNINSKVCGAGTGARWGEAMSVFQRLVDLRPGGLKTTKQINSWVLRYTSR